MLCHGVLGFAHQTSCHGVCEATEPLTSSSPAHEAHGSGHAVGKTAADSGWASDGGQLPSVYFAVILALFGAAFLGLFLGARRRRETATANLCRPRSLPAFACLPRGPTLPLLQVFRL